MAKETFKKCQFKKINCSEWAETELINPHNQQKEPICLNCVKEIINDKKNI